MDNYSKEQAFDLFAASALTGLVSKLPLLDTEGEFGIKKSQDERNEICRAIAQSALEYAVYMIEERHKYIGRID